MMINKKDLFSTIKNYYSMYNLKDYSSNIKYISCKNDLKYLKIYEENIYFTHNFNEIINVGDIPENVKCIYFYQYYREELKKNIFPKNLEVLILGNYLYKLNYEIIDNNIWFFYINNINNDNIINYEKSKLDNYIIINIDNNIDNVIDNIIDNNNSLLFIKNKNNLIKENTNNKLTIKEYNDILFYFNIKKNIY
jgi:hypothetical protein